MDRFFCILEDKECINCCECETCDINPDKVCDSCGQCLNIDMNEDYISVKIAKEHGPKLNKRLSKHKYR